MHPVSFILKSFNVEIRNKKFVNLSHYDFDMIVKMVIKDDNRFVNLYFEEQQEV